MVLKKRVKHATSINVGMDLNESFKTKETKFIFKDMKFCSKHLATVIFRYLNKIKKLKTKI